MIHRGLAVIHRHKPQGGKVAKKKDRDDEVEEVKEEKEEKETAVQKCDREWDEKSADEKLEHVRKVLKRVASEGVGVLNEL